MTSIVVGACASAGNPPGGPEDHAPPRVLAVSPDSGALNAKARSVEFTFDEVVSDRPAVSGGGSGGPELDQIFLISPRDGDPDVSWHRHRITVKPRKGFRPNTAYRVTLLPGLADLRGNVSHDTRTVVFSTGQDFPPYGIVGRVFDWGAERPANGAYVEAMSQRDTTLVYVTAADTTGAFDVSPLPAGNYLVRAIIDQNANREVDRAEKWDTLRVSVTNFRPTVELDAIERDSTPPVIDNVTVLDSVSLRVTFDKPIDPATQLEPALVRVQRGDSSDIQVTRIQWRSEWDRARQVRDSIHRADSLRAQARADSARADSARARGDTTAVAARPATRPAPTPAASPRQPPPPPRPAKPAPDRGIVITISSTSPFEPTKPYRVTANGVRNLVGHAADSQRSFNAPKPEPKPAPTDSASSARPPAADDSTRRPPSGSQPPSGRWR